MKVIYEARISHMICNDYDTDAEARAAVEAAGAGSVVKYVRGYDNRDRSCAMSVYQNGAWRGVDISC